MAKVQNYILAYNTAFTEYLPPTNSATSFSNFFVRGPVVIQPDKIASRTSAA